MLEFHANDDVGTIH